jgi:hypothetical protein
MLAGGLLVAHSPVVTWSAFHVKQREAFACTVVLFDWSVLCERDGMRLVGGWPGCLKSCD